MRRSGMLDNGWVSVMSHAVIARAALPRPARIRSRRTSRSASRLGATRVSGHAGCPVGRPGNRRDRPAGDRLGVGELASAGRPGRTHRGIRRGQRLAWKACPARALTASNAARSSTSTPRRSSHPELLAALAQVESSGNPVARTYWRWRFSWNPFELYGPASSTIGMFQITDGTFAEARPFCIRDIMSSSRSGPWHDPHCVLVQRALHTCGVR